MPLLIDGRLEAGDFEMPVINPANEAVIARCARASHRQLDLAVAAAADAFRGWRDTDLAQRRRLLARIADRIAAHADELGTLLTLEQGKPRRDAIAEAHGLADLFRYFAQLPAPFLEQPKGCGGSFRTWRRPLGVVAAIIPWNYPLAIIGSKVPPALLAGNTVVLKPAPTTPLATLKLGEAIADLLPAGVLNIVTGADDLGDALTAHPAVAKITFTGSTATGRKVMANAASSIKRVTLELGGNDAAIVLGDVDIEAAARAIFDAAFANSGQLCCAIKRLYVHDSIHDRLCEALATLARAAVVGDGMAPDTELGPLQNRRQFERVTSLLADASAHGTVMAGGETSEKGFFMRPAIVRDIADGARLVEEEQFGPLLPVLSFRDEDDALARANASPYGLSGSVWSADTARAAALAARLDVGTAWVNMHADATSIVPGTGAKQSGLGIELGEEGLLEFTQFQAISIAPGR